MDRALGSGTLKKVQNMCCKKQGARVIVIEKKMRQPQRPLASNDYGHTVYSYLLGQSEP